MIRKVGQAGINLIKKYEGFSATPYLCPAGYMTIGYGHMIIGDATWMMNGINDKQAELLLIGDLKKAENAVMRYINIALTDNQFDALVSFTFNLGAGALQRSTLRRKVNREEHDDIPAELLKWVWAGGRKLNGLVERRTAEGVLYAS